MNEWMDIEVKMCVYYTIGREKEDDWLHTASEYEKLSLHMCRESFFKKIVKLTQKWSIDSSTLYYNLSTPTKRKHFANIS